MHERAIVGLTYYNHESQTHEMVRYELNHKHRGYGTPYQVPPALMNMAHEVHLLVPERRVIKSRMYDPSSEEARDVLNFIAYDDVPVMCGDKLRSFLSSFLNISPNHFKYI